MKQKIMVGGGWKRQDEKNQHKPQRVNER